MSDKVPAGSAAGSSQGAGSSGSADAGPGSVEVEWQFDALDLRPVERWLAALPDRAAELAPLPLLTVRAKPPRRLVDRYVDTDDWRMARAGFVLRTRRRGRREEATLKDTRPAGADGLRRRLEVTEELPPAGLGGLSTDGPVGRRVAAIAGTRPLRQVVEVRTRRQPFAVRAAESEVAEVALDQTTIVVGAGQPPAHLRRVEVEVATDWAEALRPVVEELREAAALTPATRSKFETGLLAAGLDVPGPPDLGATTAGRASTLGELAFATLRTHLAALLAHEPGTRLGEDPEALHDMRVATRRLRAALDLFADAYPARATALRGELKWAADALGKVRDLDVQLEHTKQMAAWPAVAGWAHGDALGDLRSLLAAERAGARQDLLAALDSSRWERAKAALVALAVQGPSRRVAVTGLPAALVVGERVLARHRKALQASRRARRSGDPVDYHRLRIRCKHLRYSLDLTAAVYGAPARRFARKLAKLQDALGLLQDDEVARARLLALAMAPPVGEPPLSPETVFALGGWAERYRQDAEERAQAIPRQLEKLSGGAWERLATEVARREAAARASQPAPLRASEDAPPSAHVPAAPVRATAMAAAPVPAASTSAEETAPAPAAEEAATAGDG